MLPAKLVVIGRSAGSYGLKGEVKVSSFADDPELFLLAKAIYIGPDPQRARPRRILAMRKHGGRLMMSLEGITTREQAAEMGGAWIYIRAEDLPPTAEDEFYWYEVIGAEVFDSGGLRLGKVHALTETNAHDMLVVRDGGGREALIPLIDGVLLEVDTAGGKVVVNLPEGLLEAQGWE